MIKRKPIAIASENNARNELASMILCSLKCECESQVLLYINLILALYTIDLINY